jgi:glutathione S-transferase
MKVFGTNSSPFTRKVRVVAHEKALPLEFVVASPLGADSGVPALNPLGKIPVLMCQDGSLMFDSLVIAEYLDTMRSTPQLLPLVGPERFAVRDWEVLAAGIMDAAVLIRMENARDPHEQSAKWIARQRDKIERTLELMNRRLGERKCCVGQALTLADISLGCAFSYLNFRFSDTAWADQYAEIGRVCGVLEARPSFQAAPMQA